MFSQGFQSCKLLIKGFQLFSKVLFNLEISFLVLSVLKLLHTIIRDLSNEKSLILLRYYCIEQLFIDTSPSLSGLDFESPLISQCLITHLAILSEVSGNYRIALSGWSVNTIIKGA